MRSNFHIAAFAGLWLLSGCEQPSERKAAGPVASDAAPQLPSLPVAEAALDREALLFAVTQAASRSWLNVNDREQQRDLDGRRFALRLRFGCGGSSGKGSQATRSWRIDDERRVLTFKVAPDIDKDGLAAQSFELPQIEAVEGFWIERPWVLKAACPQAAEVKMPTVKPSSPPRSSEKSEPKPSPAPSIVVMPQIGIAQFFTEADARTHRRENRAYEATKSLAEGAAPSSSGYDLVISGRLKRLGDGRVIACETSMPNVPPSCVISAQFDSVTIEIPGGVETVAKWSGA